MSKYSFQSGASPATLRQRSELLFQLRSFFRQKDFVEVQTPVLSVDTVVDLYLEPFTVSNGPQPRRYLQTSPEFAMKRILASGLSKIYQITPAFRQEEAGPRHNPEFTMLEWYRCGDSYQQGRELLGDLIDEVLGNPYWDMTAGPYKQRSFSDAFGEFVGLNPFTDSTQKIVATSREHGFTDLECDDSPGDLQRREAINFLWAVIVDPKLGAGAPEIIYDWPGSESALAQTRIDRVEGVQVEVAERFELYFQGFELANGYHELLDASILRKRVTKTNATRQDLGKPQLPSDSRLLQAMDHGLPASCGVALGVDRLLMSLSGASEIDQVMTFAWDRA